MKKICIILTLIIICTAFSSTVSAVNVDSPYYPLSIHLSDPDEDALILRLLRWRYEKEYLSEHDIPCDYRYDSYFSLSYSFPNSNMINVRDIDGFHIRCSNNSGLAPHYNDRRIRMLVHDESSCIKATYQNVDFFQNQVKKAKEYQSSREQIAYINNFLCDYLEYGYATPEEEKEAEKIKDIPDGGIRLVIASKKAICGAYTDMAHIFLTLLDVPNCSMSSTKSGHHIWNYVYVDGKWRHLDVTWNDSVDRNKYFLIDNIDQYDSHDWKSSFTKYNQKLLEKAIPLETTEQNIKANVYAEFDEILNQNDIPYLSEDYIRRAVIPWHYSRKWQLAPNDILNLSTPEIPVTRQDFCRIMAQTIEKTTGKTIGEVLQEKQVLEKQINFLDTDDASVIALAKLGIVTGVDADHFNPNSYVNKVQLAVFTGRIAEKVFGVDTKSQTLNLDSNPGLLDDNIVKNSWYKDGIAWATIHGLTDMNIPDAWYNDYVYRPDELKSYTEALDVANKLYVIFKK